MNLLGFPLPTRSAYPSKMRFPLAYLHYQVLLRWLAQLLVTWIFPSLFTVIYEFLLHRATRSTSFPVIWAASFFANLSASSIVRFCRLYSKSIRFKYPSRSASFLKIRIDFWLILLFLLYATIQSASSAFALLPSSLAACSVPSLAIRYDLSRSNLSDFFGQSISLLFLFPVGLIFRQSLVFPKPLPSLYI